MKPILVVGRNELAGTDVEPSEAVTAALMAVGPATRFTYKGADLVRLAYQAEGRLDQAGLPQAGRNGFTVQATSAGPIAKAYKFSSWGSSVTLRRTSKGWVLVQASRCRVFPTQHERICFAAPVHIVDEISRRSIADISILPGEDTASPAMAGNEPPGAAFDL